MKRKTNLLVEEIKTTTRFIELKPEWEILTRESGLFSPFLSHEWFECCIENFKKDQELFILTFRGNEKIIGIAPFWKYTEKIKYFTFKKIGFITVPDTPFANFIIHTDYEIMVLKSLVEYLFNKIPKDWDIISLQPLPKKSTIYQEISSILQQNGFNTYEYMASVMPFIEIKEDWESFLKTRSRKFRKTRNNVINRMNRLGKVEIEGISAKHIEIGLDHIFNISEKSWKHNNGIAISSKREFREFFRKLSFYAGHKGWLMMWILKVNGIPIAMEYDLNSSRTIYALRADFDENFKEYSPGTYLEYHIVKNIFENKYKEYNSGPGIREYKMHWTDQLKENVSLQICNNNFKSWLIWYLKAQLIPFLKKKVYSIREFSNSSPK